MTSDEKKRGRNHGSLNRPLTDEDRRRCFEDLKVAGMLPADYDIKAALEADRRFRLQSKIDDQARQQRLARLEAEAEARLQSVNPGAYDAAVNRRSSVSDQQIQRLIDCGDLSENELTNRQFDRISDLNRECYRDELYEAVFGSRPKSSIQAQNFDSAEAERKIEEQRQEVAQMQAALERAMKLR